MKTEVTNRQPPTNAYSPSSLPRRDYQPVPSPSYNSPISEPGMNKSSLTKPVGLEMGAEEAAVKDEKGRAAGHSRAVLLGELVLAVVLSGWILVEYLHNVYLQNYVKSTIDSNASILQFAVPIGFAVIISSLLLQRRSESREAQAALRREEALRKIKFVVPPRRVENVPHHLFTIPRPARDPNFRIKKKTAKGRMARNRAGQRLPPANES